MKQKKSVVKTPQSTTPRSVNAQKPSVPNSRQVSANVSPREGNFKRSNAFHGDIAVSKSVAAPTFKMPDIMGKHYAGEFDKMVSEIIPTFL